MAHGESLNAGADRFGNGSGPNAAGLGQDAGELLTAVAGGEVGGPRNGARQDSRDAAQALITRDMAVDVVIGFEMVDIEHDQGQHPPRTDVAFVFVLQHQVELAAVRQLCQIIGDAERRQLAVGFDQGFLDAPALDGDAGQLGGLLDQRDVVFAGRVRCGMVQGEGAQHLAGR